MKLQALYCKEIGALRNKWKEQKEDRELYIKLGAPTSELLLSTDCEAYFREQLFIFLRLVLTTTQAHITLEIDVITMIYSHSLHFTRNLHMHTYLENKAYIDF